jgi:eukaryotic-like serine/threonine-protein kinase
MTHDNKRSDAAAWQRVSRILDDLLEVEPGARAAALDHACRGDPDLRARVLALLEADQQAGRFLAGAQGESDGDLRGALIGRYRITREIGGGGMGRVFAAERADGAFEQTVAIKAVRPGIDTPDGRARFLRERQILARLEHPNIARLLDGGITPDGRLFFAMDYVDGAPITTFAADRRLDVDARLALMLGVCEGVRAAHRHLIVHRDLKPSNVFVTKDGAVKLLDFHQLGMFDEAAAELRRAVVIRRSLGSGNDEQLATSLTALANVLSENGDGSGAEAPAHEALDICRRLFGEIADRTAAA